MFNPSQHDVRRFFCSTYHKHVKGEILTPLEGIAADWIAEHPEYFAELTDLNVALEKDYSVENGKTNPFLHLSLHLTIAEQVAIDQPAGIRSAFTQLATRLTSPHEAHHVIMACLGAMIWESQRNHTPFDGAAYIAAVEKHIL